MNSVIFNENSIDRFKAADSVLYNLDLETRELEKNTRNLVGNELFLLGYPWEVTAFVSPYHYFHVHLSCDTEYRSLLSVCVCRVRIKIYNNESATPFYEHSVESPCVFYVKTNQYRIANITLKEIVSKAPKSKCDWEKTTVAIDLQMESPCRVRRLMPRSIICLPFDLNAQIYRDALYDYIHEERYKDVIITHFKPRRFGGIRLEVTDFHHTNITSQNVENSTDLRKIVSPKLIYQNFRILGSLPSTDTVFLGYRRKGKLEIWRGNTIFPKMWTSVATVAVDSFYIAHVRSDASEICIFTCGDRFSKRNYCKISIISLAPSSCGVLTERDVKIGQKDDEVGLNFDFLGISYHPNLGWLLYGKKTIRKELLTSTTLDPNLTNFRCYRLIKDSFELITQLELDNCSTVSHCSSNNYFYIWTKLEPDHTHHYMQIYDFGKDMWSKYKSDGFLPDILQKRSIPYPKGSLYVTTTITKENTQTDDLSFLQLYSSGMECIQRGDSCHIFNIKFTHSTFICIPKIFISHGHSFHEDSLLLLNDHQLSMICCQKPSLQLITWFIEIPTLKKLAMMALQNQYGTYGGLDDNEIDQLSRHLQLSFLEEKSKINN